MDSFKNESVKELLDSNDHIRRVLGGKDLYLIPSVVVVGAQSHGKSSVLEMLSSVKLPSGSGMVTKRPLSIELRRSKTPGESLYFRPRDCENEWQIQRDEVEGLVKEESLKSDREQLSQNNKTGIVDLPMTLRIEGENLMDVTLIDLPGIKYDDGQAESRIKELIRNRIKAESSIILVVHNASVDTDTNEGFKMAKEVDPSGHRTLTVLTHVDTILDPLTMDQQVISYLKKTTCNFYAVCCPSASEHAAITHDEAKAKEQLFFDTHDSLKPLATQTGSTNLVRKVALMYRSAVEASQKPLEEAIRSKRINITRSIRLLPETQSPSVRFGHLWSKMVTEFQMILDGSNGSIDLHHQLHVTCTSLQISLLKVPLKLLNKHESLEPLMLVLGTIDGRMLPNFNPFKPLEKFTAERMRLHFGQAVKKIQHVIDDQFVSSEKVILPTILRGVPECMADKYKQCLELMTDEVHFVLEMTIQKIADRMQDRVLVCVHDISN
jgi:GTP-binding protein EngB required for normal cell division